jgi:hypothetical protein
MVDAIVVFLLLLILLALPRSRPPRMNPAEKNELNRYDSRERGGATYPFEPLNR